MKIILIDYTKNPEKLAATAAKICYSGDTVEEIMDSDNTTLVDKVRDMGHTSVFEHIKFTFVAENVSRTLTHQLVRHRIASYSMKSQRYVNEANPHRNGFTYTTPDDIKKNPLLEEKYNEIMDKINAVYREFIDKGVAQENARYVLPNACHTSIMFTMNARELLQFFSLRCCNRTQWELRRMAYKMLELVYPLAPKIFKNAGAPCCSKNCPEGKMSCGTPKKVKNYTEYVKNTGLRKTNEKRNSISK